MPTKFDPEGFYTLKDVCFFYDLNPGTVRRWCRVGKLEARLRLVEGEGKRVLTITDKQFRVRVPELIRKTWTRWPHKKREAYIKRLGFLLHNEQIKYHQEKKG